MKNLNEGFDWFFYKGSCEKPVLTRELLNHYRWPKPKELLLEPIDQLKSWVLYYLGKCFIKVHPNCTQFDQARNDLHSPNLYGTVTKLVNRNTTIYMKYKISMEVFKDSLNIYLKSCLDQLANHFVDAIGREVQDAINTYTKDNAQFFTPQIYYSDTVYTEEIENNFISFTVRLGFNFTPKMLSLDKNLFGVCDVRN